MIEKNNIIQNSGLIGNSVSPTQGSSFTSLGGVDYIIGTLFILIGLLIFVLFQRKTKVKLEQYKKDQLFLYNKKRNIKISDYQKTSLYVPFWEKAKSSTPIMLTILFITVGLFWIIWTATGSPSSVL